MSRTLRILPILFGAFFGLHSYAYADVQIPGTVLSGGTVICTAAADFPIDGRTYNGTQGGQASIRGDSSVFGSFNGGPVHSCENSYTWSVASVPDGTYALWHHPDGDMSYFAYSVFTVSGHSATPVDPTPPIVPPLHDINEVVRYWPAFNYATSTGTTTVGVQFSIAHPEWIDGVGYEIGSAAGDTSSSTISYVNTIYDASTTVATAQTFSLTNPFNFTQAGYYTLTAYFIQNGRKVYNNTVATILINYVPPNITVGNDGQFHFNGTTTVATSTLDALHIDCGDTLLVSSLCKIAVSFVVPDPSSIQGIKDNWNALLTKAPFSFFTESKNVLGAFASTSNSTGGSLALNLYGQNAPIVSTTTANTIGFGSTAIDALKFLTKAALWIFLAWFIYWRIGGILSKIERV